jgi:hypothetical protein
VRALQSKIPMAASLVCLNNLVCVPDVVNTAKHAAELIELSYRLGGKDLVKQASSVYVLLQPRIRIMAGLRDIFGDHLIPGKFECEFNWI